MPILLLLGAVGVVVALMAIGWRQRWDPTPQPFPPVTLKSARADSPPPPRWYWPVAAAGILCFWVCEVLGVVFDQRWLVFAGLSTFAASWGARHVATRWIAAKTRIQRIAAVIGPPALIAGIALALSTRNAWWFLPAGIVYLGLLFVTFADRRANRRRVTDPATGSEAPRSG